MSKISLGQIDLLALQQYLEIVVGFRRKDDIALDVSQVGEYKFLTKDKKDYVTAPVLAKQVAMAALDGENPYEDVEHGIPERNTVMNALNLGGIPAGDYLKRVDSNAILTDVNDATYNLSQDIRNLKDELYQLKNQLIKTGTIKDSIVYNGFIDSFIENNQKHIHNTGIMVSTVVDNKIMVKGSLEGLNIGDIIVLENNGKFNMQKILFLNSFNRTRGGEAEITVYSSHPDDENYWEGATGAPEAHADSFIYKSIGISKNGKFVFGHKAKDQIVQTYDMQYIVKDGIDRRSVYALNHTGHGYGTEINVPASLKDHVITNVQVSLAISGTPGGSFRGKIYDFSNGAVDLNVVPPVRQTKCMSTSELSEGFNDVVLELLEPLEIRPGDKYLFLIQTEGSGFDNQNTLNIGGFAESDCPGDVHNDSYFIENVLNVHGVGNVGQLYKAYDESDMYLMLGTRKLEKAEIEKLPFGLYTCEFDMYFSKANRLRVELIVNREGMFKVDSTERLVNETARARTTEIPLTTVSGNVIRDDVFGKWEKAVVGKNIFEVYSFKSNNGNIVPVNDVQVASRSDVYRVGYEVTAIVSQDEESTPEEFTLDFVGVVPGRDTLRPNESSDRLIFECEFQYDRITERTIKLDSAQHVQVQVRWHSNCDANIIQHTEELEGAIFDIVVSADQAYTQDPTPRE